MHSTPLDTISSGERKNTQKCLNVQVLRGLAAAMVVAFHAAFYYGGAPGDHPLPEWAHFGAAGVDLFFIISGFIMVYVSQSRRFGSVASQLDFLYDRATRIYPPYWVATLPIIAACLLLGQDANRTLDIRNVVTSLLLWPTTEVFPLLRVGWSLIHEVYFYLIFSFFLLGRRETLPRKLLAWAVIVSAMALILPSPWYHLPICRLVFNPFTLEFIAGALLGFVIWPKDFKYGSWIVIGGFALLMGGTYLMPEPAPATGEWRPLFLGIPALFIVGGALVMEQNGQIFGWRILQRLGDASFQIYLWHNTVIAVVARCLTKFAMPDELRFVITLGCGIAAGYLAHLYIERPLLHLARDWRKKRQLSRNSPDWSRAR